MKKAGMVLRIAGPHMILLCAAAADQILKRRVEDRFRVGEAAILSRRVVIHRSRNRGAAMNLGQEKPGMVRAFSLCAAAAGETGLLRAAAAGDSPAELTGMALILGGGAGNILDRYRQGYVTDFIRFPCLPGRLGKTVFNLGDLAILTGMAVLITARAFSE